VTVTTDKGQSATTDLNGNYTLSQVPEGSRTITVSHADYWAAGTETSTAQVVNLSSNKSDVDFADFSCKGTPEISLSVDKSSAKPGETVNVTVTLKNTNYALQNVDAYADLSFDSSQVEIKSPTGTGWSIGTYGPNSQISGITSSGSPTSVTATDHLVSAVRTGTTFPRNQAYSFTVPLEVKSDALSGFLTLKYRGTIADERDPPSTGSGTRDQQGFNVETQQISISSGELTLDPPYAAQIQGNPDALRWSGPDDVFRYEVTLDGEVLIDDFSGQELPVPYHLSPGDHTWTIRAHSPSGIATSKTQTFTVLSGFESEIDGEMVRGWGGTALTLERINEIYLEAPQMAQDFYGPMSGTPLEDHHIILAFHDNQENAQLVKEIFSDFKGWGTDAYTIPIERDVHKRIHQLEHKGRAGQALDDQFRQIIGEYLEARSVAVNPAEARAAARRQMFEASFTALENEGVLSKLADVRPWPKKGALHPYGSTADSLDSVVKFVNPSDGAYLRTVGQFREQAASRITRFNDDLMSRFLGKTKSARLTSYRALKKQAKEGTPFIWKQAGRVFVVVKKSPVLRKVVSVLPWLEPLEFAIYAGGIIWGIFEGDAEMTEKYMNYAVDAAIINVGATVGFFAGNAVFTGCVALGFVTSGVAWVACAVSGVAVGGAAIGTSIVASQHVYFELPEDAVNAIEGVGPVPPVQILPPDPGSGPVQPDIALIDTSNTDGNLHYRVTAVGDTGSTIVRPATNSTGARIHIPAGGARVDFVLEDGQ
jgi:hypothetical protein